MQRAWVVRKNQPRQRQTSCREAGVGHRGNAKNRRCALPLFERSVNAMHVIVVVDSR